MPDQKQFFFGRAATASLKALARDTHEKRVVYRFGRTMTLSISKETTNQCLETPPKREGAKCMAS